MKQEVSSKSAIALVTVTALVALTLGWYLINRQPKRVGTTFQSKGAPMRTFKGDP